MVRGARENGLVGGLTHNVEVLTRETVLALRDAFTRIVDAVLAEPSTPVASLAAGLGKAVGNEEGPTPRQRRGSSERATTTGRTLVV